MYCCSVVLVTLTAAAAATGSGVAVAWWRLGVALCFHLCPCFFKSRPCNAAAICGVHVVQYMCIDNQFALKTSSFV